MTRFLVMGKEIIRNLAGIEIKVVTLSPRN